MTKDAVLYEKRFDLNCGHDGAKVQASVGYGDLIEIEFGGRDPTTVLVRLPYIEDARAIGTALIEAADAIEKHHEK